MSTVQQTERPYTAEDLATMPADGRRYEVIGGELIVTPAPSTKHQWVSAELMSRIRAFGLQEHLGVAFPAPLDVRLGRHDIVEPDIVFVLREHIHIVVEWGIEGSPDLLIEVVSPGSRAIDRIRKAAIYSSNGVIEYWLVDPRAKSILAQELVSGEYVPISMAEGKVVSRVLNGLLIDPRDIFAFPDWMAKFSE